MFHLKENHCKKCEELNERLGIADKAKYEAVCDDCWDKRVDDYEEKKNKEKDN